MGSVPGQWKGEGSFCACAVTEKQGQDSIDRKQFWKVANTIMACFAAGENY